ncbi:MAG: nadph-dependent fmn reductase [Adhaeribacter sp.]|nr:nadph-dependent fmn reductase [Adhaeribacter sp.]
MITIIAGTNRPNSNARVISEIYAGLLKERNIDCQILDLVDLPNDFTNTALYDNCGQDEGFNQLVSIIEQSEKAVFIIPEYNNSIPGVLKTFIDGFPYPNVLRNKKTALVGISTGTQGGALAISHFTDILNYLGVHVLAVKPRLMFIHKNLHQGKLTNTLYQDLLNEQIDSLLNF